MQVKVIKVKIARIISLEACKQRIISTRVDVFSRPDCLIYHVMSSAGLTALSTM